MLLLQQKKKLRKCADKKFEELKDTQVNRGGARFFTLKTRAKIKKGKIIGKYFQMQVDTDSDIIRIAVNFWQ